MRLPYLATTLLVASLWPLGAVSAQEEDDDLSPAESAESAEPAESAETPAEDEDAAESAPGEEPAAAAAMTSREPFGIRRGFFVQAEVGTFVSFGGTDTGAEGLPSRSVSFLQPYLGVFAGYDVYSSESFNMALGLKLASGYVSGAARPTAEELANTDLATTLPSDYALMSAGVGAAFSFFLSPRVALNAKVDGGMSIILPNVAKAAQDEGAGGASFGGIVGGGLGVEYFTLLNDFSVGVDLHFAMAFNQRTIPAGRVSIPLRYTF